MSWQKELRKNITDVEGLLPFFPMAEDERVRMGEILERFPLSITPYYLSLIDLSNPQDPIRKMAVPSVEETDLSGSFDTSGEADNTIIGGLQHKYAETVMILSTNQCAMYCRHCFRKRLVGLSDAEVAVYFDEMRDYVLSHKEISNVLISGGDALLCDNARLRRILDLFVDINHIDTLRIASRVPVVFPERITGDEELLALLEEYNRKKRIAFVTQYNHPRELTAESVASAGALQRCGIALRNQTVLLHGVNDSPDTLGDLLRGLTRQGIAPYYIFQCRPVSGVKKQFQVPLARGFDIVREAFARQNGLGKTAKYCMSHVTGKIEILGKQGDSMLYRYHEAKNPANLGRIFALPDDGEMAWIPDDFRLN